MQIVVKGKNIEVSESLRHHVERKVGKLARYTDDMIGVQVELSTEKTRSAETRQVVQVTANAGGTLLRAEVRAGDMFAAVDGVMDKMRRQTRAYKDRLHNRQKTAASRAQPAVPPAAQEEPDETEEGEEELTHIAGHIVRTKHFAVKPMSAEEAVDQMELLGHDFFVFAEARSQAIHVVYKRRDSTYGLLIPEHG